MLKYNNMIIMIPFKLLSSHNQNIFYTYFIKLKKNFLQTCAIGLKTITQLQVTFFSSYRWQMYTCDFSAWTVLRRGLPSWKS